MARALINFNDIFNQGFGRNFTDNVFNDWDILFSSAIPEAKRTPKNKNVNVTETDTSYKISVLAPGREKKDFNISLEGEKLSVSLDKQENIETQIAQTSNNYAWKTPNGTTPKDIFATYDAGILNIIVNKPEDEKIFSETIKVN